MSRAGPYFEHGFDLLEQRRWSQGIAHKQMIDFGGHGARRNKSDRRKINKVVAFDHPRPPRPRISLNRKNGPNGSSLARLCGKTLRWPASCPPHLPGSVAVKCSPTMPFRTPAAPAAGAIQAPPSKLVFGPSALRNIAAAARVSAYGVMRRPLQEVEGGLALVEVAEPGRRL